MADMNWSDCGRTTKAQNLYSGKGRKGRRMVGGCGQNETKTSLYANRLPKIWTRLFKMKYGRAPSEMETWVAIRTGKIAENVRDWEKQALVDKTGAKRKRRINLGARGVPYSVILQDWLDGENAKKAEQQRLQDEEDARLAAENADLQRRGAIIASSEVPLKMLVRIANGEAVQDAVQTIYGVTPERISTLMEAFGLIK